MFLFTVLCIQGMLLRANPVELPYLKISELWFNSLGEWRLELSYSDKTGVLPFPDSVVLFSLSDTARVPVQPVSTYFPLFVLAPDSLDCSFAIGRTGDCLCIRTYTYGVMAEHSLTFGDADGAVIGAPEEGQSICCLWDYFFTKDSSPSPGLENDTSGTCGTLKGTMYDVNLEPVCQRTFFYDYAFRTDDRGGYAIRVLSAPTYIGKILYRISDTDWEYARLTPVNYTMEPDSLVIRDFMVQDSLKAGIIYPQIRQNAIRVSPCPVRRGDPVRLETSLPVLSAEIWFRLVAQDGRLVQTGRILDGVYYLEPPESAGFYILTFTMNAKLLTSTRLVVYDE